MGAKMLCRKCGKITPLVIRDRHYKRSVPKMTTLYEQFCCGSKSRWTKDYLIEHTEYKFSDWRDKNGC